MKPKHLHCAFCDTLTETKQVDIKDVRSSRKTRIVAEVCPNCKEQYYDAAVLIKLENSGKRGSVRKAA
jgi:hypothetical protein